MIDNNNDNVKKTETAKEKINVPLEFIKSGASIKNLLQSDGKYVVIDGEKYFIPLIFADMFSDVGEQLIEFIRDGFEDCVASRKDLNALVNQIQNLNRTFERLTTLFSKKSFEKSEDWYLQTCQGVADVLIRMDMIEKFHNPELKMTNGDMYYYDLYNAIVEVKKEIYQVADVYLGIEQFKVKDRSKFYPEFQQGFALIEDNGESTQNGDVAIDTITTGYMRRGLRKSAVNVIRKEVVSIKQLEPKSNDDEGPEL